jgi:hypothetical protein
MKSNIVVKIIMILIIPILIIAIIFIPNIGKNTSKDKDNDSVNNNKSSIVSVGVKDDDLGNIVNGQYFFDDGTNQYYSNFDTSGNPHVYVRNNKTGTTKTIFDGFGWSFAVHDGWLYFSGNSGTRIDATYTLFRIRTDGTNLEHILDKYTVNMNFYKEWLYYDTKPDYNSTISSIYRSKLDGTNEEEIVSGVGANGLSVVFDNKLYYLDSNNGMYRSNPDGSEKVKIINEKVYYFIIGEGRIIYTDESYNIKSCKVDGSDIKTIRVSSGGAITKINSYKDTIIYVIYDKDFNNEKYSWKYYINTIKTNGSNDKRVYEGYSYGFYVNMLNNKIYVLDYYYDSTFAKMIEVTRNMNIDGTNLQDLYR